jgi:hypothetical protein
MVRDDHGRRQGQRFIGDACGQVNGQQDFLGGTLLLMGSLCWNIR